MPIWKKHQDIKWLKQYTELSIYSKLPFMQNWENKIDIYI